MARPLSTPSIPDILDAAEMTRLYPVIRRAALEYAQREAATGEKPAKTANILAMEAEFSDRLGDDDLSVDEIDDTYNVMLVDTIYNAMDRLGTLTGALMQRNEILTETPGRLTDEQRTGIKAELGYVQGLVTDLVSGNGNVEDIIGPDPKKRARIEALRRNDFTIHSIGGDNQNPVEAESAAHIRVANAYRETLTVLAYAMLIGMGHYSAREEESFAEDRADFSLALNKWHSIAISLEPFWRNAVIAATNNVPQDDITVPTKETDEQILADYDNLMMKAAKASKDFSEDEFEELSATFLASAKDAKEEPSKYYKRTDMDLAVEFCASASILYKELCKKHAYLQKSNKAPATKILTPIRKELNDVAKIMNNSFETTIETLRKDSADPYNAQLAQRLDLEYRDARAARAETLQSTPAGIVDRETQNKVLSQPNAEIEKLFDQAMATNMRRIKNGLSWHAMADRMTARLYVRNEMSPQLFQLGELKRYRDLIKVQNEHAAHVKAGYKPN